MENMCLFFPVSIATGLRTIRHNSADMKTRIKACIKYSVIKATIQGFE